MVPVYVPDTAAAGIVTTMVGFHEVEFDTVATPTAMKAVRGDERSCARPEVSWPGVRTAVPLEAVTGPDQYEIDAFPIVSAVVADPVVKLVPDTLAVQVRPVSLSSTTVTVPSWPDLLAVPEATEPRLTVEAGTVIERAPQAAAGAATIRAVTALKAVSRSPARVRPGAPTPGGQGRGVELVDRGHMPHILGDRVVDRSRVGAGNLRAKQREGKCRVPGSRTVACSPSVAGAGAC